MQALCEAQNRACAITRIPFALPKSGHEYLTQLVVTREQAHMPVPVRIDADALWQPGNVILVLRIVASFYEACGDIGTCAGYAEKIRTPLVVPDNEAVLALKRKYDCMYAPPYGVGQLINLPKEPIPNENINLRQC